MQDPNITQYLREADLVLSRTGLLHTAMNDADSVPLHGLEWLSAKLHELRIRGARLGDAEDPRVTQARDRAGPALLFIQCILAIRSATAPSVAP